MTGLQNILCKLYSRDSHYSEYVSGSQYADFACIRNLNMLEFYRVY